jgi:hypothetical protein
MSFLIIGLTKDPLPCQSFLEAERLATKNFKVGMAPVRLTRGGKLLALVLMDSDGKVWTELTTEGCQYA